MNHLNNLDTRGGLIVEIRVNCNVIEQMWDCRMYPNEGELVWLCEEEVKESVKEAFWNEFNSSINPYILDDEEELMNRFEELLENWKKSVIYKEYEVEVESESEDEQGSDPCPNENCGGYIEKEKCVECDKKVVFPVFKTISSF